MAMKEARAAYADLARYYGLREQDAFLSGISQTPAKNAASNKNSPKSNFYKEIFGDGHAFKPDSEIFELFKSYGKGATEDVCVTPNKPGETVPKSVRNERKDDQGWGKPAGDYYSVLEDLAPGGVKNTASVSAYQVFPIARGVDIIDTEIITLFLNSITSLEMSRAVPYIDISVSAAVGMGGTDKDGDFTRSPVFSLGRFLGATPQEKALHGRFQDQPNFKINKETKTVMSTVASMELFTTPQTLVDATDSRYDESTGGRIDVFRPFLNLEGLDVTVSPSGQGTITYKTAKLTMRLFDRGRLPDIAPLVSPQRKGNVWFNITHGWSHPAGTTVRRPADAQQNRLGELIDAMRVSESYIVTNSSFNFQDDGSVQISVDLAIVGSDSASSTSVLASGGEDDSVGSLASLIEGLKKMLRDISRISPPDIDLPQVISTPSEESVLSMSKEEKKAVREVISSLRNSGGSLSDLSGHLIKLVGVSDKDKNSAVSKFQSTAAGRADKLVDHLETTPDPFLRIGQGVTKRNFEGVKGKLLANKKASKNSKQRYVSFGKLMTYFLSPAMSSDTIDLQFVFTAFNHSAAAVYDFNIAQFPIELGDFRNQLKSEMKKRPKMSTLDFIQFIEEKFFGFHGSKAYGLSKIYDQGVRHKTDAIGKYQKSITKAIKKKGGKLSISNKMRENLKNIYGGKRSNPSFTPPQVTMSLVTRPNSKDPSKNITRVTFFDAAAGRVMPVMDAFTSAISLGHFVSENLSGNPTARGARHNEVATQSYQRLRDRGIVKKLSEYLGDGEGSIDKFISKIADKAKAAGKSLPEAKKQELKQKLEATNVVDFAVAKRKLREVFFEFAPSLIYGAGSSGMLSAQISSQQNDALTAIALVKHHQGAGDDTTKKQDVNLPLVVHPTSLKITSIGCPFFRFSQKFFVDMGTNTTADNFYAITAISHRLKEGEFTTSLNLIQLDSYGRFVNLDETVENILISAEVADLQQKKKRRRSNKK